jgi:hypothetical protein
MTQHASPALCQFRRDLLEEIDVEHQHPQGFFHAGEVELLLQLDEKCPRREYSSENYAAKPRPRPRADKRVLALLNAVMRARRSPPNPALGVLKRPSAVRRDDPASFATYSARSGHSRPLPPPRALSRRGSSDRQRPASGPAYLLPVSETARMRPAFTR